jgi:hypothetical protein
MLDEWLKEHKGCGCTDHAIGRGFEVRDTNILRRCIARRKRHKALAGGCHHPPFSETGSLPGKVCQIHIITDRERGKRSIPCRSHHHSASGKQLRPTWTVVGQPNVSRTILVSLTSMTSLPSRWSAKGRWLKMCSTYLWHRLWWR